MLLLCSPCVAVCLVLSSRCLIFLADAVINGFGFGFGFVDAVVNGIGCLIFLAIDGVCHHSVFVIVSRHSMCVYSAMYIFVFSTSAWIFP